MDFLPDGSQDGRGTGVDEQTTTPEPQPGLQGEGGIGWREGREETLAELAQQLMTAA